MNWFLLITNGTSDGNSRGTKFTDRNMELYSIKEKAYQQMKGYLGTFAAVKGRGTEGGASCVLLVYVTMSEDYSTVKVH